MPHFEHFVEIVDIFDNIFLFFFSPEEDDCFDEFYAAVKHLLFNPDEDTCYKEMFRILDDQKKGYMMNEELKSLLNTVKSKVQMTDEEVDGVVDFIDKNKDGRIDYTGKLSLLIKNKM